MSEKNQRSNVMLAFFTLVAVIILVSVIGFFTLGKGPEIIQGQAEATEYRVSSKVPGRILKYWVYEGDKVRDRRHTGHSGSPGSHGETCHRHRPQNRPL